MKKYLLALLYTLIITLTGSLITSLLYYFDVINGKLNVIFLFCTFILSLFVGSLKLAKESNKKGVITGLLYFAFWFIISVFVSLVIFKTSFSFKTIIYYVVLLLFSILGGVLGKNLKEEAEVN